MDTFDLRGPGRHRHRLDEGHREGDRGRLLPGRRQGGGLEPQGRRLRGGDRGAQSRAGPRRGRGGLHPVPRGQARRARGTRLAHPRPVGEDHHLRPERGRQPLPRRARRDPRLGVRQDHGDQRARHVLAVPARAPAPGRARGRVDSSSSRASRGSRGAPISGAYAMSKVACHQLARNLAVEYGPHGVRVNAIAPGLIKTDFAKALWTDPERLDAVSGRLPLRRIGESGGGGGSGALSREPGRLLRDRPGAQRVRRSGGGMRRGPAAPPAPPAPAAPAGGPAVGAVARRGAER